MCIQKKPERGSSDPPTNNFSSAALRKLRSHGLSQPKRSWARMRRTGPKPGIFGTKSGRITVLHFFLNQMAWKGGSANLSRLPGRSPKVWADAYLLAFASVTGAKLVTFDRALESRGVEVLVL